jgi:hypothetical protein
MKINVRKQFIRVRIATTALVWSCKRNKKNGKIEDTEKGIRTGI